MVLCTHGTLMMGTEMVHEMQIVFKQPTQLVTRDDFINLGSVEAKDFASSGL
jgi:hypothetical protein